MVIVIFSEDCRLQCSRPVVSCESGSGIVLSSPLFLASTFLILSLSGGFPPVTIMLREAVHVRQGRARGSIYLSTSVTTSRFWHFQVHFSALRGEIGRHDLDHFEDVRLPDFRLGIQQKARVPCWDYDFRENEAFQEPAK